jgi:hypothetical protein
MAKLNTYYFIQHKKMMLSLHLHLLLFFFINLINWSLMTQINLKEQHFEFQ